MVTVDDYASLIDPTRPNSTRFDPNRPYPLPQASTAHGGMGTAPEADGNARRGCNPRTLAQGPESGWTPLKLLPPLTVATRLRR